MKTTVLVLAILFAGCAGAAPSPATIPTPAARDQFATLDHERVDYWVDRFTNGDKRAEITESFRRMPQYETMIREKLRVRDMPEELVYVAMAESGFNDQAHSIAEATGIWQLVPDTARRYGLKVDDTVDERHDAVKSTDAAISYLSYLFNRFGSWYLAIAAYNAGENRIARIMNDATASERGTDADYYRLWEQWPGETRDFIPAIVALSKIGAERSKYGFAE